VLWTLTEIIHKHKNDEGKGTLSVAGALQRVDTQSILFFLGILLAISALASDGQLAALATRMDAAIGNVDIITMTIVYRRRSSITCRSSRRRRACTADDVRAGSSLLDLPRVLRGHRRQHPDHR